MCGIAGLIDSGLNASSIATVADIICDRLAHRGPDDYGIRIWDDHNLAFIHRRLSIIDLSDAGHNPMPNEDNKIWIVFNGEIYNYKELRQQLVEAGHIFRSHTDTEVIIHAYEEWGDAHVERLRGMFAYAIYDRRERYTDAPGRESNSFRLFLARDRLGIKPLFYYSFAGNLSFASEIKGILANPKVDRSLDRSAIFDYLTYWYIPAPKTAYKHIRKLLPGHYMVWEDGQSYCRQYWELPLGNSSPIQKVEEAVELIAVTLNEAVQLHTMSDVPLGVFLSGGLDSSSVTALLSRTSNSPVRSFSIGFDVEAHSEIQYAQMAADHMHTVHEVQTVGVDHVREMLPTILSMYDEPYADGSAVPTYQLSSITSKKVKVALSGDGGDEVFGGYHWYRQWMRRRSFDPIPLSLRQGILPLFTWPIPQSSLLSRVLTELTRSPFQQYARLLEMFSPLEKRRLLPPEWQREFAEYDDYWYFRQYWHDDLDPWTRIQFLDLKTYLPDDILTKVDRASMANSLEVRPPLLDHVLIETVFSIPSHLRLFKGNQKYLLKEAVSEYLPAEILTREKKGFSAPWYVWMKKEWEWAQHQLAGSALSDFARYVTNEQADRLTTGSRIWALLLLNEWWQAETKGLPF